MLLDLKGIKVMTSEASELKFSTGRKYEDAQIIKVGKY